jgi:hypothetical protein
MVPPRHSPASAVWAADGALARLNGELEADALGLHQLLSVTAGGG